MDKNKIYYARRLLRDSLVESPANKTLHVRGCNAMRKPSYSCSSFCAQTLAAIHVLGEEVLK